MPDDRLTATDWIEAGLQALAHSGLPAIRADTLAKTLRVSRGSFYWHFADVTAFHAALLAAWESQATDDIIRIVDTHGSAGAVRLQALAATAFAGDGRLERQIRAWSSQDPAASAVLTRIDAKRISYVETLFGAEGLDKPTARTRARFLYLALVGQYAIGPKGTPDTELPRNDVAAMITLLLTPPPRR